LGTLERINRCICNRREETKTRKEKEEEERKEFQYEHEKPILVLDESKFEVEGFQCIGTGKKGSGRFRLGVELGKIGSTGADSRPINNF